MPGQERHPPEPASAGLAELLLGRRPYRRGPFLAVYLASALHWNLARIGDRNPKLPTQT